MLNPTTDDALIFQVLYPSFPEYSTILRIYVQISRSFRIQMSHSTKFEHPQGSFKINSTSLYLINKTINLVTQFLHRIIRRLQLKSDISKWLESYATLSPHMRQKQSISRKSNFKLSGSLLFSSTCHQINLIIYVGGGVFLRVPPQTKDPNGTTSSAAAFSLMIYSPICRDTRIRLLFNIRDEISEFSH